MATFAISVLEHQKRRDGKYPVSIRITLKRKKSFIKTEYYVTDKQIENGEIIVNGKKKKVFALKDKFIIKKLNSKIELYDSEVVKLGGNIDYYTIEELKDYLIKSTSNVTDNSIDFVEFSKSHIEKIRPKQKSRARRLTTTLNAFIDYFGRERITVSEITGKILKDFEDYLLSEHTIIRNNHIKKEVTLNRPPLSIGGVRDYLGDIRNLFNEAVKYFNDEEKGEIKIHHDPFKKYEFPKKKQAEKRSLKPDVVKAIITAPDSIINGSHGINRVNLARDVFTLSFYLIGMNTIDLYNAETITRGRITYYRSKTRDRREDKAKISIRIEPEIMPLVKKYKDATGKRAFKFYQMYSTYEGFNEAVNKGLKHFGDISTYHARHSWATIARNDCKISKDDVHEALNHAIEDLKVTDLYIEKDWSVIDNANRTVIDYMNSRVPKFKNE